MDWEFNNIFKIKTYQKEYPLYKLDNLGKYNLETSIAYFDIGRFRIAYSIGRFYIPYPERTLEITLPFEYLDTNYMVIGTHDYARSDGPICNIQLDASKSKLKNKFSITSELLGSDRITAKFLTIGLYS